MSELIKREDAIKATWQEPSYTDPYNVLTEVRDRINALPTIDAIPIKFIHEVIEYLEKCRDYAIHEETKTAWNDEAVALIMLLHEWDAWNECGRTGKYGERRADDERTD